MADNNEDLIHLEEDDAGHSCGVSAPSKKKKKKKKKKPVAGNMVRLPGCYVAHEEADWILGVDVLSPEELEDGPIPDLSVDPDTAVLSAVNVATNKRTFYVTIGQRAMARTGKVLDDAPYVLKDGRKGRCTTFVLVVPPLSVMDVCHLDVPTGDRKRGDDRLDVYSHISDLAAGSAAKEIAGRGQKLVLEFPLGGCGPYLCSQGFGGCLTHFTPNTYHAIDLDCPSGTLVLAVGNGVVTSVTDECEATGPHAQNLFDWNSITLQLDKKGEECFVVEYVHIAAKSARVKVGDRVRIGDVLCLSGSVGFCPTPHLHIQCHTSTAADAPTVPFEIRHSGGTGVLQAGKSYSRMGKERSKKLDQESEEAV